MKLFKLTVLLASLVSMSQVASARQLEQEETLQGSMICMDKGAPKDSGVAAKAAREDRTEVSGAKSAN